MANRIRDHIRSNVVGYVALFVALSGTAYAVDGPLPGQNQVGSQDIINSEVKTLDVLDNTLTGADVNEASLSQVPRARLWGASGWRDVWHSGSDSDGVNQINAGTCRTRAIEASTRPGDIVLGTVHGRSAPNPLPAGSRRRSSSTRRAARPPTVRCCCGSATDRFERPALQPRLALRGDPRHQPQLSGRQATRFGGCSPPRTARTFSATRRAMPSRARVVAEPMCGRSTQLGASSRSVGTSGSRS